MPINKNDLPQQAQTNAQKVRQKNQQAAQSAGGYQSYDAANTEFASETSAQEVSKQNQQSMAKKNQNQA